VTDVAERLARCFSSVFPTLSAQQIHEAEVAPLVDSDSLAGVTLVAVIDQEFGLELDVEDLVAMGTFQKLEQFLTEKGQRKPSV